MRTFEVIEEKMTYDEIRLEAEGLVEEARQFEELRQKAASKEVEEAEALPTAAEVMQWFKGKKIILVTPVEGQFGPELKIEFELEPGRVVTSFERIRG